MTNLRCQGTNCGTTTGDHSEECLREAAKSQGWEYDEEEIMQVKSTLEREKLIYFYAHEGNHSDGLVAVADYAATKERERIIDLIRFADECICRGEVISMSYIIDLIKELP